MKGKTIILGDEVEELWKSGEAMMNEARFRKLEKENKQLRRALKRVIKAYWKNERMFDAIEYAEKVLKEEK